MPELSDKDLDTLLTTLDRPEPPAGLSARIMSVLPGQPAHWTKRLAAFFGAETLLLPAGGALASLMIGVMAGYWALPMPDLTVEAADLYAVDAFGSDPWDTLETEVLQ